MLTFEEICEIIGAEPDEIVDCADGMVMTFGKQDFDLFDDWSDENED